MTAYYKNSLENLYHHKQIDEATAMEYISKEQGNTIKDKLPINLYTPNLFVKIGLGVLTYFIIIGSTGLLYLMLSISRFYNLFFVFCGMVSYVFLEIMATKKKHYNSGVDNLLMIASVAFISSGLAVDNHSDTLLSLIVLCLSIWMTIRFADRFAACSAVMALLAFLYFILSSLFFAITPFFLIISAGIIYYFANKKSKLSTNFVYKPLVKIIAIIALLCFYVCGNYFIINEMSDGIQLPTYVSAVFWLWTMIIPILYLVKGIISKDLIFIRSGVLLIAASVITFKYYHTIMPVEQALLIAGIVLTLGSYILIQKLKKAKWGFIYNEANVTANKYENLEGIIIGETFGHQQQTPEPDTKFGGGSFGGSGAGSNY